MTSIPSNLTRVPNLLASRLSLGNLARSNVALLRVQEQLSTGRAIVRPSDDIVKAAGIGLLDDRLERSEQLRRNQSHADAALGVLDSLLTEAHDIALSARSIASEQSNAGTSDAERSAQAVVVDEMIRGLLSIANRQSVAGHALGGSLVSRPPFASFLGGVRYTGEGPGLVTDLGPFAGVPVTLGAGNALTATSGRVRGAVDLDPRLTSETRLDDLGGARGLGVSRGVIEFSFAGGPRTQVDLTGADSIADVATRVTSAIRAYEAEQGVTVLGPSGVTTLGGSLSIDVAPGSPNPALTFHDLTGGHCAADLGLADDAGTAFDAANAAGVDLAPRLTWRTPVSALGGVTGALGRLRLANAGRSAEIDLSGAETLSDIRSALEGAGLGVRVQISDAGDRLDLVTDVSAGSTNAMSVSEVAGGGQTASRLGLRSMDLTTRLADFNFGRGVSIVDNRTDPVSGAVTRGLNTDIRIMLGDPARTTIDIDLRPQDLASVGDLLARINQEAADQLAAAGMPTTAFGAVLNPTDNGILLVQDASFGSAIRVDSLNNSGAAENLGLLGGTYDVGSATYAGSDRAKVRVESLFSHLLDLAGALRANDTRGIALAGEDVNRSVEGLVETRGLVGAYAKRVEGESVRETSRALLDEQTRSVLRDTDYTSAASRLALLQTQLQAGLQVTALAQGRTLLDYLG